jgi:hypothetical protein
MKVLRWLTVGLVWAAVVVLALLSSVAFHLRLPMAREVARQATNRFVSGEIGGRLHIGYIEELSPYHVVARDTTLYDQYGAPVAYGDRVVLTFDHRAAMEGTLRFSSAHLHTGWVDLIEGDGLPTFIELFDDGLPSSPGPGLHAIVDDLRVQDVTVTGELLGLQGIRLDGVTAHGRLEFTEEIEVRIFSASGDIVEPFPFTARLEHLGGIISTDPHEGIRLHVRTHEGDQRAHANVVYAVPEGRPGDSESELDLLIHAMPVHGETLAQLGFEWADLFHGPATGHVRLYGPVEDLRLRASLETAGGPTQLEGHLPVEGEGFVEARTDGLQLERVMRAAPTIKVAGAFRLLLPADPDGETRAHLNLEPMRYESYHVPALEVEGALLEDRFRVDRATGTSRGARLTARGHVDYDGRVSLRVQANVRQVERDPNLSRLLPGARARLEADMRFATADRSDRIDFRGRIVLHDVSYGALTAKRLTLDGFAKGNPERPEANLKVDAHALAVGGYPLGTAHLKVRGGPHNYEGTGVFEAPGDRRFELDATVEASPERYVINAQRMELALGALVWRGAAERVVIVPGQEVTAERFLLAKGHQRLEAQGRWRFDGPDELRAELQSFDLAGLEALLGDLAPAITGIADAHLVLEGPFENPEILLEGALRGTSYRGVDDMDLVYVFTYREGQLALDAQVDLQDRGSVMMTSSGVIDPEALEIADALEDGVYEVSMAIADLKLPVAQRLLDLDLPPAEGVIGGRIAVSGPIQAPSFEGALHVPALVLEDWPALSVHTDFSYVNGAFGARGAIGDEHGDLIEVEGGLLLDLMNLARHPEQALAVLEVAPWRMAVRLAKRRLGALPAPLRAHLPEGVNPLRVAASGTLSGGSLRTHGDLLVSLDWDDPFHERPCGQDAHPRATIQARLENGVTRAQIMGHLGPRAVLSAKAEAPTPIDEWLEEARVPPMPPVQLAAQVRQLDTGRTPWLCEGLDGPVSGTLEVTGLFTDRPEASASLATNGLVVRRFREEALRGTWAVTYETPPMEGVAEAVLRHDGLTGNTTLRWRNGGSADVHAELPLQWDTSHPVPTLRDDAPIDMEAQLSNMPLSLLLSPVPNLVDVEGTVNGRIASRGLGARPDLRGEVQIHDGYFQVMPTGQQLSAVEGEMTFRGDWIELSRLVAREREGRLEIRGALQLDGFAPSSARIELEAHQFPVRSDGAVLATIGGRAVVEAEIEPGQSVVQVVLREMALALPDEGIRSVQDLEPHADVRIVGYEPPTTDSGDPYPIVIAVRSAQPFWVRRNDFAALVTMDLGVTYMDPDTLVDGDVTIRRGFFEVFGKRFEVDEARMRFDGGKQMNPMVTLRATHRLRMGGPGDTVSVSVTGRMESPEVQFTTTVPECQDRGDIIALLISGRCARTSRQTGGDEMQASQQAASFLAGVAAGVLSMSAREQFGDIIPVIVVESGDQAFRSTRVRAGFKADSLIPKPLRPYVLGAYVEGFFSTSGTENMTATTVQGRDNGFLLELQFPANIVGAGAFSPPHSWSLDVTWEP